MHLLKIWIVFCITYLNTTGFSTHVQVIPNYKPINLSQQPRHKENCSKNSWKCKNGDCIDFQQKCDGSIDCVDGSDETFAICHNNTCPSYLFRCSYGACVNGNAKCDNKVDCADKSDELYKGCYQVNVVPNPCKINEFQCWNGHCIKNMDLCDGQINCHDGSDETITECSEKFCPSHLFRCAYGACVDGDALCNGIDNCNDGSDESSELCPTYNKSHKNEVETKQSTYRYLNSYCQVPEEDRCTIKLIEATLTTKYVKHLSMLHYTCDGIFTCRYCVHGMLTDKMPCGSVCNGLDISDNYVKCTYKGNTVNCNISLLSGSKMTIEHNNTSFIVYCSNSLWKDVIKEIETESQSRINDDNQNNTNGTILDPISDNSFKEDKEQALNVSSQIDSKYIHNKHYHLNEASGNCTPIIIDNQNKTHEIFDLDENLNLNKEFLNVFKPNKTNHHENETNEFILHLKVINNFDDNEKTLNKSTQMINNMPEVVDENSERAANFNSKVFDNQNVTLDSISLQISNDSIEYQNGKKMNLSKQPDFQNDTTKIVNNARNESHYSDLKDNEPLAKNEDQNNTVEFGWEEAEAETETNVQMDLIKTIDEKNEWKKKSSNYRRLRIYDNRKKMRHVRWRQISNFDFVSDDGEVLKIPEYSINVDLRNEDIVLWDT